MIVDIDRLPWTKLKASSRSRDPSKLDTVVLHITAVKGGFGVTSRQITAAGGADEALFLRWRDTPYHGIVGQKHSVWNRRFSQRSYHGNAGNYGVGMAIDIGAGESPSEEIVERAQHMLLEFAGRLAGRFTKVTAHRCFSKSRLADPGAEVWQRVVTPLLKQGALVCRYETCDGGLPIPRSWDGDSPFDEKGRKL